MMTILKYSLNLIVCSIVPASTLWLSGESATVADYQAASRSLAAAGTEVKMRNIFYNRMLRNKKMWHDAC